MKASTISCISVSDRIRELAEFSPHAPAIEQGELRLSYRELDVRADQFGNYLTQVGVKAGSSVAICMDRSVDWIVTALAILRVGAAYVPLDPLWPDSRLGFVLEDSGASVVVAAGALVDRLAGSAHTVDAARIDTSVASEPRFDTRSIPAESVAYVIYTSGSSGTPKGVEITHGNLAHLIRWHVSAFDVSNRDRASHLAGLGFDAAVWEIWPNLAAGATICIPDDAVRSSPALIQQWILQNHITIGFVPTVHAGPMLGMAWPERTELRYLLTGGDTLRNAPGVQLPFVVVNNYGPTECTVVATSSVVKPGVKELPPIGLPIAGSKLYLLTEQREEVSDGQIGEIYIGGGGVGRGYRNLPAATEQSFLPDPFAAEPGARMYRTGDRGIRRSDGEIEFCGRLDRQVKVRGQRVELDEVGSILAQHEAVEFCVVTASDPTAHDVLLVAYILLKPGSDVPSATEFRQYLQRSLPQYMIPSVFMELETLPVSPNGKLDLKMLPSARVSEPKDVPVEAKAAPIQKKLLKLVQELLRDINVTADDNFFLAGGHSLLGMQLIMRVRQDFGVGLSLRQLFEAPTVTGLAMVLERKQAEARLIELWRNILPSEEIRIDDDLFELGGDQKLVSRLLDDVTKEFGVRIPADLFRRSPTIRQQIDLVCGSTCEEPVLPSGVLALQPEGDRASLFWVHYPCEHLAKEMGSDRPFLAVTLTDEDLDAFGEAPALEEIAGRMVAKILAARPAGPYNLGGFCIGGFLAFEIARQLEVAGHEVSCLVMLDTPSPAYYRSPRLLEARMTQPLYVMKRAARLGMRTTFNKLFERVSRRLPARPGRLSQEQLQAERDLYRAQRVIEAAASRYQPRKYGGNVVMLVASIHPPHVNFLPGWRSLISGKIEKRYIKAHHLELVQVPFVRSVAEAVSSHLLCS